MLESASSGPSTASVGRVTGHRWSCPVRAAYAAHFEPSCPAGSAFFTARDMVCNPANNYSLPQSGIVKASCSAVRSIKLVGHLCADRGPYTQTPCLRVSGSVTGCNHSKRASISLTNAAKACGSQFPSFRLLCIVKANELKHGMQM